MQDPSAAKTRWQIPNVLMLCELQQVSLSLLKIFLLHEHCVERLSLALRYSSWMQRDRIALPH